MKIGKLNIENGVLLAPMESITDLAFRIICRRMGADIVYSEFIASEALIRNSIKSLNKMKIEDEEHPVAVQIFGANIDSMVYSAKLAEDAGADILDINFGCWVKKVVNSNAGAALLKNPRQIVDIIKAIVNSINIPVTAKTRLGWDKNSVIISELAKMIEESGASAITVHCRTRDMGMKGEADWNWISHIKSLVKIPVILNGDVKTPENVKEAFNKTGCDAVMIGRAAIGNPFIFKRTKEYLKTGIVPPEPAIEERIKTLLSHLELILKFKGLPRGINEFRKHYSGYLKGIRNASIYRQKLVVANSFEEITDLLEHYLNSQ